MWQKVLALHEMNHCDKIQKDVRKFAMDNLIFSLQSVIPVFLVMIVGYCLSKCKIIDQSFVGQVGWIMAGSLYKVVITPLAFVIPMTWLGFSSEQIATAFVLFSVPSAMNAYIVTKKMGGDGEPGAAVIVAAMFLPVLTMPAGIWLIRSAGII